MHFYSQHGEDFILNQIFKGKNKGFFVEVGCIDGMRYSNTYAFEKTGWAGICIEAHEDYIQLLKKNRPESIIIDCAAGSIDENETPFYANSRGSLSTLDPTKEQEFKRKYGKYFSGFTKKCVKQRTLTNIFKENLTNNIDLLSIDVEGSEAEVLSGINFKKYRPTVLIVESDSDTHENNIDLLIKKYYIKGIKINQNIIYISAMRLLDNIFPGKHFFKIIHTQHPLDTDGDKTYLVNLEIFKGNKTAVYDTVIDMVYISNE